DSVLAQRCDRVSLLALETFEPIHKGLKFLSIGRYVSLQLREEIRQGRVGIGCFKFFQELEGGNRTRYMVNQIGCEILVIHRAPSLLPHKNGQSACGIRPQITGIARLVYQRTRSESSLFERLRDPPC